MSLGELFQKYVKASRKTYRIGRRICRELKPILKKYIPDIKCRVSLDLYGSNTIELDSEKYGGYYFILLPNVVEGKFESLCGEIVVLLGEKLGRDCKFIDITCTHDIFLPAETVKKIVDEIKKKW